MAYSAGHKALLGLPLSPALQMQRRDAVAHLLLAPSLIYVQHTPLFTFIHATFSPLPDYPQGWLLSYEGLAGSLGAATSQARTAHGKDAAPLLASAHAKHPRFELEEGLWT